MKNHIALFRGVNVGGNRKLPMQELRGILSGLGLQNVKTYLQSGNAVFTAEVDDEGMLARAIGSAIRESHQFAPGVLILATGELEAAVAGNPFPEGEDDPTSLHLFFLESLPTNPDMTKLESLRSAGEKFELRDKVFYLHAPEGIGRSRLASKVEKALGATATARNWRSVQSVMSMATKE